MTDITRELKKINYEFEKNIEKLKKKYGDIMVSDEQIFASLCHAEKLRCKIKVFSLVNDFGSLGDAEKVEYICNEGFKDFYATYPIVSRYIVCDEMYDCEAFKRFLVLCKRKLVQSPDNKEHMEDLWIQCQASYIRFLHESQQTHIDKRKAEEVWNDAYRRLKKEFSDFKDQHKAAEKKVLTDTNRYKIAKLDEVINFAEKIGAENMKELDELQTIMQDLLFKQNYEKCLPHITSAIPTPALLTGYGKNEDAEETYQEELKINEYRKRNKFMLE